MQKNLKKLCVFVLLVIFIMAGCSTNPGQIDVKPETQEVFAGNNNDTQETGLLNDESSLEYNLTGNTFRILLIGSEEQPLGDGFRSIQMGVQDAVSYLNEQGGVFGANLTLDVESVNLADEDYIKQLLEKMFADDPHIVLMAIPVSEDLYDKLNGQSIPVLYFGVGGERLPKTPGGRDNLFWLTPLPDEQMAFTFEVLRDNWNKINPSPEFPEMIGAYLTWEGDFGNTAYSDSLDEYLLSRAIQIAVKVSFRASPNATVSNALLDSLTSKVGVVYTDTFSFGPASVANDLTSLGMQDFFVLSGSVWCCDDMNDYLYSPPFKGMLFTPRSLAWWNEVSNPAINLANEIADFGDRENSDRNFGYLIGLGAIDIAAEALKLTVREEKNGSFQARSIYPILSSLENYLVMNGLFEVDYTNQNRSPNLLQLWQYDNQNGWQAISEMVKVPVLESLGD